MSEQKLDQCIVTKDEQQAIEARLIHLLAQSKGWSMRRVMQAWSSRNLKLEWNLETLGQSGEFNWKLKGINEQDLARPLKGFGLELF